jgi:hypothetical protein
MTEDNSHAGQGAVMLDIGGDIGALVVMMPEQLRGQEIEIRPVGYHGRHEGAGEGTDHEHRAPEHEGGDDDLPPDHDHADDHDHEADHDHADGHAGAHDHAAAPHLPHVAVVPRPLGANLVDSAVFPELRTGSYELYVRPDGPVQLQVEVRGGEVTEARWPDAG